MTNRKDHSTSTTTNADGTKTEETNTKQSYNITEWQNGWEGTATNGTQVFFTESPEKGDMRAALFLYNPSDESIQGYVGEVTTPSEGVLNITDMVSGNAYTFGIVSRAEDGDVVVNLGDDLGEVTMSKEDITTFADNLKSIDKDHKIFPEG